MSAEANARATLDPRTIGGSEATLLYSGSPEGFAAHEKVLAHLGTNRFLGADPAGAAPFDVGLLDAMYAMYTGFFHSVALIRTEPVRASEFTTLLVPWLSAVLDLPFTPTKIFAGVTGSSAD